MWLVLKEMSMWTLKHHKLPESEIHHISARTTFYLPPTLGSSVRFYTGSRACSLQRLSIQRQSEVQPPTSRSLKLAEYALLISKDLLGPRTRVIHPHFLRRSLCGPCRYLKMAGWCESTQYLFNIHLHLTH